MVIFVLVAVQPCVNVEDLPSAMPVVSLDAKERFATIQFSFISIYGQVDIRSALRHAFYFSPTTSEDHFHTGTLPFIFDGT